MVVVDPPGLDVEVVLDVELELVLEVALVLDVELELVLDVELELVLDVVVAVVEKVSAAMAPFVMSFGSSATRIAHAFWLSHANRWLGP